MTSTKATAGGVSGFLVTIAGYLLTKKMPGWDLMPEEVRLAFYGLIAYGIPWACVYFAPANQHTVEPDVKEDAGV